YPASGDDRGVFPFVPDAPSGAHAHRGHPPPHPFARTGAGACRRRCRMIELGQHWEFLVAAYGGTVLVVGALIGWTAVSARQAKARVETLEAARQARKAK